MIRKGVYLVERFLGRPKASLHLYEGELSVKKIMVVVMFVLMSFLISCQGDYTSPEEKVTKLMAELQNYEAEMEVRFTNNTKMTTMKMKQTYDMNGQYEMTLIEPESLKGYKTIWDGEKIEEYNPIEDKKVQVKPNPVKNQVLFGSFVHNYLHGEKAKPTMDHEKYVTVEASIPGNYKYMAKEKAWFNKNDGLPIKLEIYDREGNGTISIDIISFKYNK